MANWGRYSGLRDGKHSNRDGKQANWDGEKANWDGEQTNWDGDVLLGQYSSAGTKIRYIGFVRDMI